MKYRIILFSLLMLSPFTAPAADEPAQNPRDATSAELVILAEKLSKDLHTCAYSRRNKDAAVEISNRTEDYVDKDPLVAAFQKSLKLKADGKKITLKVEISSEKSVAAGQFSSTYSMKAYYQQDKKNFCEKSQHFTKSGAS